MINISEAAQLSGLSTRMMRHYEELGLIGPLSRTDSGYRQYRRQDVAQLRFIQHARALGFSVSQIGELLNLRENPQRASREVKAVAENHLRELERKMTELKHMKRLLQKMVSQCPGDDDPHCAILETLDLPDSNRDGIDKP